MPTTPRPAQHLPRRGFVEGAGVRVQQVRRRRDGRAGRHRLQPLQAAAAAQREAAARLPHRPVEQRVVAAGQDRRRVEAHSSLPRIRLGGQPAFELCAREQPLAAKLRRGQATGTGQVVEGALRQAEQGRRLPQGENIRHAAANSGGSCQGVKLTHRLTTTAATPTPRAGPE
jgi:hypothetical protein